MKAIYKVTILDRLREELDRAKRNMKTIDYFLLTHAEHDELRRDCNFSTVYASGFNACVSKAGMAPPSSAYRTVTLPVNRKYRGSPTASPYCTIAMGLGTVLGIPIAVAPIEYHPS